jgi:hypothetical protein
MLHAVLFFATLISEVSTGISLLLPDHERRLEGT